MEIGNDFQKMGYFWLPDEPKQRFAGLLTIDLSGKMKLEFIDQFADDENFTLFYLKRKNFLKGKLQGSMNISLIVTHQQGTICPEIIFFYPKTYNQPLQFIEDKFLLERSFNAISFCLENISSWLGLNFMPESYRKTSIPFKEIYNINNELKLSISIKVSGSPEDWVMQYLTTEPIFTIKNNKLTKFDELYQLSLRIKNFFIFILNSYIVIHNISLK